MPVRGAAPLGLGHANSNDSYRNNLLLISLAYRGQTPDVSSRVEDRCSWEMSRVAEAYRLDRVGIDE